MRILFELYKLVRFFNRDVSILEHLFAATSDSEVRLRLAQEDTRALELGKRREVHNEVAPGLFVYLGLELEELQSVFQVWMNSDNINTCLGAGLLWTWVNWGLMQRAYKRQRSLSDPMRLGVALMRGSRFNICTCQSWLRFARLLTKVVVSHWLFMRLTFICRHGFTLLSTATLFSCDMSGSFDTRRAIALSMTFVDSF